MFVLIMGSLTEGITELFGPYESETAAEMDGAFAGAPHIVLPMTTPLCQQAKESLGVGAMAIHPTVLVASFKR